MSSDSTGEIYVITKTDGSGVSDVRQASTATGGGTPSGSAPSPSSSNSKASKRRWNVGEGSYWVVGAAVAGVALGMV
jgi:hypothetical protein